MWRLVPLLFWMSFIVAPATAAPRIVCTIIADVDTGETLVEQGDCATRATPASTFKIALAVMGYDAGFLADADTPRLSYRAGDPDWGGADWTQDTTPARWMTYSVVWYSQRITRALGAATLTRLAQAMAYGNADFSGDAGYDNGLERAWIASSLQISPREQVAFLRGLVTHALPVSDDAMVQTRAIVERRELGTWSLHGKTGAAYPRRADRSFDYARGYGWYIGWAERGAQHLVFARLTQASERTQASPGNLTRDGFLAEWPQIAPD